MAGENARMARMRKGFHRWLAGGALGLALAAGAQTPGPEEPRTLSLEDAIGQALAHNRDLHAAIAGPVTQAWTISALQLHKHGIIICDEMATDELKVGTYRYFKDIEKNNI